ncbi:MAG TPA: hypothetical protein VII37_07775, partial [Candidatus Acidoferrum sp.]
MGRAFRWAQPVVFYVGTLLIATGTLRAQDPLGIFAPAMPHGIPQDWSHRHIIYTRNGSVEDMMRLRDDPRFLHSVVLHYMREHRNQTGQSATAGLNEAGWNESNLGEGTTAADTQESRAIAPWHPIRPIFPARNKRPKVDWSVSLGPTAGLALGETPAVYTYNYAKPSCSNLSATPPVIGDFVVYTINAAAAVGKPGQANLVGLTNLYTA